MQVFAIVPVNKLSVAKSRLSAALSTKEREELVICMLRDVLDSLEKLKVVIISPDRVGNLLKEYDFEFIHEKEKKGLNSAVETANEFAIKNGADATLFVPADTPLITTSCVEEILSLGKVHPHIISPSRRGGTGILFRRPPDIIEGRFTSASFSDHMKEAALKGIKPYIYESFQLALDIDTPEDIDDFLRVGKGTRTYDFLINR